MGGASCQRESEKFIWYKCAVNVRKCGTWASMPALLRTAVVSARIVRLMPQTRALGQSAPRKLVHARCAPTRDDEHAVSMLTLGP